MQLTRLVYASKHKGLSAETVNQILQKSRANNVRDQITGALIMDERLFMQLIEGNRLEISRCIMRIMQDRNHYDLRIISCRDVGQRLFQEWNMHLIEVSRIKAEIMANYSVNGSFNPGAMSEFAIEDMCRTLAVGKWGAEAA